MLLDITAILLFSLALLGLIAQNLADSMELKRIQEEEQRIRDSFKK